MGFIPRFLNVKNCIHSVVHLSKIKFSLVLAYKLYWTQHYYANVNMLAKESDRKKKVKRKCFSSTTAPCGRVRPGSTAAMCALPHSDFESKITGTWDY